MTNKKVLFITNNWIIGGLEKVTKNICEHLNSEGLDFQIDLLIIKRIKKHKQETEYEFPLKTKVYKIYSQNLLFLIFRFFIFLNKNKYDLILTACAFEFTPLIIFYRFLTRQKFKIVITFHNFFDFKKRRLRDLLGKNFFTVFLYKQADFYITVSYDLENYVKDKLKINSKKIKTIYNPIIDKQLTEQAYEVPSEYNQIKGKKILCVARLNTAQKDFETLIRAFNIVKEKIDDAKLIIIGEGPDKEKIITFAKQFPVFNDIIFLGAKISVYPYFKYSDIFVLSSYYEGLPTVLIEAMAFNCPVVATDCPFGPRELIRDGKTGLLVPIKNPKAMAGAIIKVLTDEDFRLNLIKTSKEIVSLFQIEHSVKEYRNIISELLKREHENSNAKSE